MLPRLLVPHADEWYRLCERACHVEKITISGALAEALREVVAAQVPPEILIEASLGFDGFRDALPDELEGFAFQIDPIVARQELDKRYK